MPQSTNFNGSVWEIQDTALDVMQGGAPAVLVFPALGPSTVAVYPAPGSSALVEFTTSGQVAVKAGTARWNLSSMGTDGVVNAATTTDIPSPLTALRVTASGGNCTVEVLQ